MKQVLLTALIATASGAFGGGTAAISVLLYAQIHAVSNLLDSSAPPPIALPTPPPLLFDDLLDLPEILEQMQGIAI